MNKPKAWLQAARLRTLPLSVSGIIVGTALAGIKGVHDNIIFLLAILTTIGFQITSNFANDYGDGVKGTDNADRIGPSRALQSGALGRKELKKGIIISVLVDLILVAMVLYTAFAEYPAYIALFALLGLLSIWAAIRYTVGDKAYGYRGLGDLFVFIFFGLLSVLGSMFLYTKFIFPTAVLPATSIGLLSVAVLNLNNMRDLEPDSWAGKKTLAVILGASRARTYHYLLIILSFLCMLAFNSYHADNYVQWLNLLAYIPLAVHLLKIGRVSDPSQLDPELKKIALSTFLLSLLFYFTYYFL